MTARFGMRVSALLVTTAFTVGAGATAAFAEPTAPDISQATEQRTLLKGSTTASYYWDDASGRAGDTGLPASGIPMRKGLAASPSWPLMTEGYVVYKGKKAPFFVGDRGPGAPSNNGIMLDLDAKTFADLTGGTFNSSTLGVDGNGGQGHIKVQYVITKWGNGVGKKNHPVAFSTGAWGRKDTNPAKPPVDVLAVAAKKKAAEEKKAEAAKVAALKDKAEQAKEAQEVGKAAAIAPASLDTDATAATTAAETTSDTSRTGTALALVGGLAVVGGVGYLGRGRIRRAVRR
ncbi:hypothetical protein [Nonomuraea dietziae]|uniref:Uncharacterized protein n=1 Tax=Nonomuraea dietziae TaxID=65515 RepID=A0A7W5YE21_9ACTN|nr:hypothetical protein [Nonomuraea dietziae]MBB3731153.1 hypothetical protein [Nonomuraea dietziae]